MAAVLAEPLFSQMAPRSSHRKALLPVLLSFAVGLGCAALWNGWAGQQVVAQEPAITAAGVPLRQQMARAWQRVQAVQQPMLPVQTARLPALSESVPTFSEGQQGTSAMNRRDLLSALLVTGPLLSGPAQALIPDDDEADLIQAAKAKRKAKLQEEKKTERAYMESSGMVKNLESELVPVQIGIAQLAKAGLALEKGEIQAASEEIQDEWIEKFKKAVEKVSTTTDASKLKKPLVDGLKKFKDSLRGKKDKESRAAFKDIVVALQAWSKEAQVDTLLKGI